MDTYFRIDFDFLRKFWFFKPKSGFLTTKIYFLVKTGIRRTILNSDQGYEIIKTRSKSELSTALNDLRRRLTPFFRSVFLLGTHWSKGLILKIMEENKTSNFHFLRIFDKTGRIFSFMIFKISLTKNFTASKKHLKNGVIGI